MKSLPPQVWVAIAHFIPALCLKDMLSVNRFFFNLAMDYRYRQISFTYLNERMLWLLVRLRYFFLLSLLFFALTRTRDSAIAQRVKTLYIYPDFLKRELYATHVEEDVKISSDVLRHKLLKSGKCGLPAKFILEFMQDVLSKLPNVSEYHITWTGLPLTCLSNNPAQIFSSIFASAPIRRLTITISLENLSYLDAQVFSRLSSLEELRMVLHSEIPTSTVLPIPATPDLLMYSTTDFLTFTSSSTTLASAISYVRNTLKTLEIEIRGPSPLGSFLPLIDDIPNLEKLLVSLPIDGDIQFDNHHSALSTFIDRHSATLRALALHAEQPIFSSSRYRARIVTGSGMQGDRPRLALSPRSLRDILSDWSSFTFLKPTVKRHGNAWQDHETVNTHLCDGEHGEHQNISTSVAVKSYQHKRYAREPR